MFKSVGNLYLDPSYQDIVEKDKIEKEVTKGPVIKLDQKEIQKTEQEIKKKKKCC